MIYDKLENLGNYSSLFPEVMDYLGKILPQLDGSSADGKTVLIEDKLFFTVQRYDSMPVSERKVEIHREFIDLQMLLDGTEYIYYTAVDDLSCASPYDPDKDCGFYNIGEEKLTALFMKPGSFALFLPEEGHLPCCGDGSAVVKVVVKIHRSLLV